MRDDFADILNMDESGEHGEDSLESGKGSDPSHRTHTDGTIRNIRISGMFRSWWIDYASYVILERAVPHLSDGLKPVQRRILHAMNRLDDGRYNKVANIIGYTMQYHPHGDASIGDALVQLGQRDLLIDTQGNWGNLLTGDSSAAPRYIEARLSKFAKIVLFNPKITTWKSSYDGRNKEPITLPVKFPLLLAQGVEGIAVGLASKILPHNFNELIDASIAVLKGETFELFPDFPTGGFADCSRYNDGLRGGSVKIRAKIKKVDPKTLMINEVPFGTTTSSLIDSILKANDKGKIKIKKIDDNTADVVEILIHLIPGTSPDKTIDALYAFTDCEVSISPNSCVIDDNRPLFNGVSELLKSSVNQTQNFLKMELEIRMNELKEEWHFSSLEKIFIEKRIYRDIEACETWEAVLEAIKKGLDKYKKMFHRAISEEDIIKLTRIEIRRISKFNTFQADKHIASIEAEMDEVNNHLENIVPFTIQYFKNLKKQFGAGRERKTELRSFENIEATQVVLANEKLYVNRVEGFFGTGLKKDEFVCECSDIDDIIVFLKDGFYQITKVSDKSFVGKNIMHIAVYRKNDERTIYNLIYRDGKAGPYFMKRFAVTGITRDKMYAMTKGQEGSKVMWFTANPNGEAEIVRVHLKPKPKLKKLVMEIDFSAIAIKGRSSLGNMVTKNEVHKVMLKEQGSSTLGGINVYFEQEVMRLNNDGRGILLGEFRADDKIIMFTSSGKFRLYTYDLENHFEDDLIVIEKYNQRKVYTLVYFEGDQQQDYIKRFHPEDSQKLVSLIGEHPDSKFISINSDKYPRLEMKYGGKHKNRPSEILDVEPFIGVKGWKARGKRLSNFTVDKVEWLEPLRIEEPEPEPEIIPVAPEVVLENPANEDFSPINPAEVKQMTLNL